LDKSKAGDTQPAGKNAFQMTHNAIPSKPVYRRTLASASNERMKIRWPALEHERPERRVQLRLRERVRHCRGRLLDSLEQS
jgi:hypothetical protein